MSLERRNVIFHIDVNSAFLSWELFTASTI